mgnify:FL=1
MYTGQVIGGDESNLYSALEVTGPVADTGSDIEGETCGASVCLWRQDISSLSELLAVCAWYGGVCVTMTVTTHYKKIRNS